MTETYIAAAAPGTSAVERDSDAGKYSAVSHQSHHVYNDVVGRQWASITGGPGGIDMSKG